MCEPDGYESHNTRLSPRRPSCAATFHVFEHFRAEEQQIMLSGSGSQLN